MRSSSWTRRLLPMPGMPTSVTRCGVRAARTRCRAPVSPPSSCTRPTRGARPGPERSTPKRARGATASHAGTGRLLPFASTGSTSRYSITRSVARNVCSPTSTPPRGAAAWSRAQVLTGSPLTIASPACGRESSETSVSPVLMPTRTSSPSAASSSPSSATASTSANAARTARSGSSSCATGAPKTATTASPMNFSTVPPCRSSSWRARAW